MTMDRHDTIGAMLDEYALGQLSQSERRDVESHVRECKVCAAGLRELSVVMEGLAHSVDPVAPPPALKQRVLASLAAQPQEPRRSTSGNVVAMGQSVVTVRRGVHPAWLAAAAVAILGLAAALYSSDTTRRSLAGDVERARADAAAAGAAAADAQATAAEIQRELGQYTTQADLAVSILTSADMRPVPMAGRENATGSASRAYWSATRGLLIVANDLPVPPPGRIYQVWIIPEKAQPISAGLLGERGSGRGMLIVPPPTGAVAGPVTVAVTDEPPGGLAAPSGTIRLAGSI
jgi:anti-sigma-K factor RskA